MAPSADYCGGCFIYAIFGLVASWGIIKGYVLLSGTGMFKIKVVRSWLHGFRYYLPGGYRARLLDRVF